ncbi:helix-turn-helix domain-containing protein [Planobispora rosea]|uniref:helix-turn-helix domain-containing protein n=1 Tax=Planobispora rosea TaxID=35762 RepID=UPI00083AF0F9|nr:helix-turn-helix domain-containing protein [Planobispora rosea]
MREKSERITIADAAKRLGKPEPTVRVWASRYRARRLLKYGKTAWYDWLDLATIHRQIHLGLPVPATPEERDELRASLRSAA